MRTTDDWTLEGLARPWGERPSLHAFVRRHLDAGTGKLRSDGTTLPDEAVEAGGLRWAAGALDGVMGHHVGDGDGAELRVKQLTKALADLCEHASSERLAHLDRVASQDGVLSMIDDLLGGVVKASLPVDRVHAVGELLAREAAGREAVKLGVALLGLVRGFDDRALLLELGAHDEFTLFAAVALARQSGDDAEASLWELAKRVDGWGRIHVVERLAGTQHPGIKAWLLREGFRNSVMDEYLAYTCATTGGLHVALAADTVDDALLAGAAGLFVALANGGPAEDLADYAEADAALGAWLHHLERRPLDLVQLDALDRVAARKGLAPKLAERIERLRHLPAVDALITAGLADENPFTFWQASVAALARGRDVFDVNLARVEANAKDADSCFWRIFHVATDATIDRALTTARRRIDLAAVATGPAESMGFGPEFSAHRALDDVLQALRRFPGRGVAFIAAALASPVTRNRNLALHALADWTPARWPPGLSVTVQAAAAREPVDDVRARFTRVLAEQPSDE